MAGHSQIKIKTETERFLFKAYTDEKAENDNLRHIIQTMQAQINELQQQVRSLSQPDKNVATQTTSMESSSQCVDYNTDEEELAKETEWIRVKTRRNKKRKLSTSPTQALEPGVSEDTQKNKKEKEKRIPHPPPIIVDNVVNYQSFFDTLSSCQPADTFTTKIMSGKTVKINAHSEDSYKSITKMLSESDYPWHSYENKQDRPIRVMVKNLHFTCQPERIMEDLQKKGFQIEDAANKLSWKNKEPLNMFVLTFKNSESISLIYNIKSILGCKVEVHPIKTSQLVPQCKRCQAYGHTQKYCSKEPRCVKCTGKHLTRDCVRPTEEKPKCVHCGEPHPANYRGCIVAKEMQNMKNKNTKKSSGTNLQQVSKKQKAVITEGKQMKTYAQATAKKQDIPGNSITIPPRDSVDVKLDRIIRLMSTFESRLANLENGAKNSTNKKPKNG